MFRPVLVAAPIVFSMMRFAMEEASRKPTAAELRSRRAKLSGKLSGACAERHSLLFQNPGYHRAGPAAKRRRVKPLLGEAHACQPNQVASPMVHCGFGSRVRRLGSHLGTAAR